MATLYCAYEPCRRKIPQDGGPYGGYCSYHANMSTDAAKSYQSRLNGDLISASRSYAPAVLSPSERLENDLSEYTNMDEEMAHILVRSIDSVYQNRDLTVPNIAMSEQESATRNLRDEMIRNGADTHRIERVQLIGLHRRVLNSGNVQSQSDYEHEALIIDRDKPSETVIDPTISTFAPVFDRDKPVDDQIPSGDTPFGDAPYVGTYQDYVRGYHLWWDRAEVSSW